MDKILLGVAASTHPIGVKKALINKLTTSASKPLPEEQIMSILDLSARWIIEAKDETHEDMGNQVFEAWSKYNHTIMEQYFVHQFLIGVIGGSIEQPRRTISFIHRCLKTCHNWESACKVIQAQTITLARECTDISSLSELAKLLIAFPECLPKGDFVKTLCITIIQSMSKTGMPAPGDMKMALEDVGHIGMLLQRIWADNLPSIIITLTAIFGIISEVSDDKTSPSVALGALVQHAPVKIISVVTANVAKDSGIADSRMTAALTRMIDWLSWPGVRNIDRWVVGFLQNLAKAQKFTILINVTLATVEKVFVRLCYPIARESALPVLTHMLLSFQHSPEAFHKIASHVPVLLQRLKEENTPSSIECEKCVAELTYCLMYQHAGYPEVYEPVLAALKHIVRPSDDVIVERLKQSAWTAQGGAAAGTSLSFKYAARSETGKTGLVNLGNTCFMNSVLQALYMTCGFREELLSATVYNKRAVLGTLQSTFAFLTHTQRAAHSPRDFSKASRPPWFTAGSQQDCSEFLKYLLDRLDEEEKAIRVFQKTVANYQAKQKQEESSDTSQKFPESQKLAGINRQGSAVVCQESGADALNTDKPQSRGFETNQVVPQFSSAESQVKDLDTKVKGDKDESTTSAKKNVKVRQKQMPLKNVTDDISHEATQQTNQRDNVCSSQEDNKGCSSQEGNNGHASQEGNISGVESTTSASHQGGDACSATPQKPSIVERYFGGKSTTHIRCHNCNCVSSRTETFFDLPLAFPESQGKTMLGGESNIERERVESSENLSSNGGGGVRAPDVPMVTVRQPSQEQVVYGPWPKPATNTEDDDPCKQNVQTTVHEMISHFLTPEVLTGENKYRCENCESLQDAEKSIEIVTPPRVLVLSLMRFSYDVKTQRRCKILTDVKFPRVLHLQLIHRNNEEESMETDCEQQYSDRKHLPSPAQHPPCTKRVRANTAESCSSQPRPLPSNSNQDMGYVLTAVIVHSGLSSESGHYYCYARHSEGLHFMKSSQSHSKPHSAATTSSFKTKSEGDDGNSSSRDEGEEPDPLPDRWYLFNDSRVSYSSYDSFGNVTKRFPKDTAYLLFYQRLPDGMDDATTEEEGVSGSSSFRDRPLRKDLLESVRKDNAMYLQEREIDARAMALKSSTQQDSTGFNMKNFNDKHDPPGGCGGGGGGFGAPPLVF